MVLWRNESISSAFVSKHTIAKSGEEERFFQQHNPKKLHDDEIKSRKADRKRKRRRKKASEKGTSSDARASIHSNKKRRRKKEKKYKSFASADGLWIHDANLSIYYIICIHTAFDSNTISRSERFIQQTKSWNVWWMYSLYTMSEKVMEQLCVEP